MPYPGAVARNGRRRPQRPRLEVRQASASPDEAAAIAAAIEQFLRDTAPAPAPGGSSVSPWLRAGLLEGVGVPAEAAKSAADSELWGRG